MVMKSRTETIKIMNSIEATLVKRPRYNTHACGTGKFASRKELARKREKREFEKEKRQYLLFD